MIKKLQHIVKTMFLGKRATRGESLAEVLAAIVIGTFALLMLVMAISVSSRISIDSRNYMDSYYTKNSEAIAHSSDVGGGVVEIADDGDSASSVALVKNGERLEVEYYKNDSAGSSEVVLFAGGGS